MTGKQKKNKELIERYPFWQPRNVWTGEIPKDYDYSYTLFDDIYIGWQIAFGEQLSKELKEALTEANYLEDFRFSQIKEKYGRLRMYHFGAPKKVEEIISKYSALSANTCIECGQPSTRQSRGWICPFCDDCGNPELFEE